MTQVQDTALAKSFDAICDIDEQLQTDCGADLAKFLRDIGYTLRHGGRVYRWAPDKLREIATAIEIREDIQDEPTEDIS